MIAPWLLVHWLLPGIPPPAEVPPPLVFSLFATSSCRYCRCVFLCRSLCLPLFL
jgi:hypothetical protein